jgi:epoxyqueuosine reductase
MNDSAVRNAHQLVSSVRDWARELGFSQIGVSSVDLSSAEPGLKAWLAAGFHGGMDYMARHGLKRARPAELVPGTVSVITARMDYLPRAGPPDWAGAELERLQRPGEAVVSVYARGRDYHKVLRARLSALAQRLAGQLDGLGHRVFTDSAPVLEAELASRSGLGWRGKHTLVLDRQAGSMFFLGEIFVDMALPASEPVSAHCGSCTACIDLCPTRAIVAPFQLDARRCISYLTIEHAGPIPVALRPLMGNRIYGCDDCQLVCPWNKFAQRSALPDFDERGDLAGDLTGPVGLERSRIPAAHRGQCDSAHRPRALAAQPGGGSGQRAGARPARRARDPVGASAAPGTPQRTGARACGLGLAALRASPKPAGPASRAQRPARCMASGRLTSPIRVEIDTNAATIAPL